MTVENNGTEKKYINIFIANLDWEIKSEDLNATFSAFGSVHYAHVVYDKETKKSKGYGYVEMESADEAINAINALNGLEINGRKLDVKIASPKGNRPPKKEQPEKPKFEKKPFQKKFDNNNRGDRPYNKGGFNKDNRGGGNYQGGGGNYQGGGERKPYRNFDNNNNSGGGSTHHGERKPYRNYDKDNNNNQEENKD